MARLAHAVSLENPHISADVIEVSEYPNLARMYNVMSVPKTVINEVVQFVGSLPEAQFVEKVLGVGVKEPAQSAIGKKEGKG